MVNNELLVLVYETVQRLTSSMKEIRASVNGLNVKIDEMGKRIDTLEHTVNDVTNPSILTIGEGHVNVRSEVQQVRDIYAEMRAKLEVYELHQHQIESEIKNIKRNL